MSDQLSPALAAISFDQMTAVSARGERAVFNASDEPCSRCLFSHVHCEYGISRTFCAAGDRKDKAYGIWRPAP